MKIERIKDKMKEAIAKDKGNRSAEMLNWRKKQTVVTRLKMSKIRKEM